MSVLVSGCFFWIAPSFKGHPFLKNYSEEIYHLVLLHALHYINISYFLSPFLSCGNNFFKKSNKWSMWNAEKALVYVIICLSSVVICWLFIKASTLLCYIINKRGTVLDCISKESVDLVFSDGFFSGLPVLANCIIDLGWELLSLLRKSK